MLPRVSLVRGDDVEYLLFSTRDAVSSTIFYNGSWAKPLQMISKLFYEDMLNPLVLDIGANLGSYCIPIAKDIQSSGGVVFAFEPQRIVYYQLCGNIFLNSLDNVYAFNQAVGEVSGKISLPAIDYQNSQNIGGFSIDQNVLDKNQPVRIKENQFEPEVPVIRLDDLHVPNSPCLIKIDVEGLERQVLTGGKDFLARHNYPPVMLEVWSIEWFAEEKNKLVGFIQSLGYEIFYIMDEVIAQHPRAQRYVKFVKDIDGTIRMGRVR